MQKSTIGILAGMGPHSTAPFIDLVIHECRRQYGAKNDIDFPRMMIYSLPTSFYADRPIDHSTMEAELRSGLQDLERFGVDFTAIACNMAHIYFSQLEKSIRSPLLNMVELALDAVPRTARKIALIASRPTVESKIYQIGIRKRGFEVADSNWQSLVDELIESTRATNDSSFFKETWDKLIELTQRAGADLVIVACLDLSAISKNIVSRAPILDASHCLAKEIVGRWLEPSVCKAASKSITWNRENFLLTTDETRLQFRQIHHFLSNQAYWSLGIPYEIVTEAAKNSLCFGLFDESKVESRQIGFARVVTDRATFAWLCDVYIEPDYRGRGLAKWMMDCLLKHPALKGLRRFCLATKDAHSLYANYGFEITKTPSNWMEIKDNDLYRRMQATASSPDKSQA